MSTALLAKGTAHRLHRRRNRRTTWITLACLVGLAGCSHVAKTPDPVETPRVWPSPPDPARIAYVQSILRPADLGIKASALTRFGRWVIGSDKGNEFLMKPFGIGLDEN